MLTISAIFWFVIALLFAAIEVEIEGKYGWAEKLPTWYRTTGPVAKAFGLIMGKKPITGYHAVMFLLPLMIFHSRFFTGLRWTRQEELWAMATYFLFCATWDFLWFILNPYFGIQNFSRKKVWWHSKSRWLFGLPMDYWGALFIAFVLATIVNEFRNLWHILTVFCTGIFIVMLLAPLYHRWYFWMRKKDDRENANIFH